MEIARGVPPKETKIQLYLVPFSSCGMLSNIVTLKPRLAGTQVYWKWHRSMDYIFYIRFWYLRCCSCPWNRGRQHLAMSLKTCHNIEAGFLTGWLLCLSPNSEVTASDDNFARTSVCRWLPQKPTSSQVEAARNPEKGGLYSDLPTPRWTCLKRLSGLHLPRYTSSYSYSTVIVGLSYIFSEILK